MSDQKMQECFEFFYDLKWEQVNDFAQQAWKAAWLASRETMVIELPNRFDEKYQDYYGDVEGGCFNEDRYINDAQAALTAAGVKCK